MTDRYTSELDCAPGRARPSALLPGVIRNTGLALDPDLADQTLFGNWTWSIPPEQVDAYLKVREVNKERITTIYNEVAIRYGRW